MKNNGPNKEPCGTPEVTVNQSEANYQIISIIVVSKFVHFPVLVLIIATEL